MSAAPDEIGLAFDGAHIWVTSYNGDSVTALDAG